MFYQNANQMNVNVGNEDNEAQYIQAPGFMHEHLRNQQM
jgi:hypothetical protein